METDEGKICRRIQMIDGLQESSEGESSEGATAEYLFKTATQNAKNRLISSLLGAVR